MRAIMHDSYGEAEVLDLRDIPSPTVGDNHHRGQPGDEAGEPHV